MVTRVLESAGGPCSLGDQPGGLTLERGPAGSPAARGVGLRRAVSTRARLTL